MPSASTDILTLLAITVREAGPVGMSPDTLAEQFKNISRSTLNRRLADLVKQGSIKPMGAGRSTRYVSCSPFTQADFDAYFAKPWEQRPVAVFDEAMLQPQPGLDADKARRMQQLQRIANPLDKRFLTNFLVHFSWGSSVLEGSSYSSLDTQALLDYGHRNKDKPTEDAVLILNHKRAIEYLWANPGLTLEKVLALHDRLTDNHEQEEVKDSDHFLPDFQRGKPREFEEVNLGASAYLPPFRPGTGYIAQALQGIIVTAQSLPPFQAALYLMTRIAYLQAFANGNKRTARLAANYPLVGAGLLPLSFADVDKAQYIRAMAAVYELRSLQLMENLFIHSYARSVVRGSQLPMELRRQGFDMEQLASALAGYVHSGQVPNDARAQAFISTTQ